MAGMIGMAQTLAVYHYGYHTLKNRLVQYHEPAREPSDAEAVLEWGLDTPFTSQDKPPLAIAMVVTLNGVRSLRRYRLVIAQKAKLRLTQEVTAALASHSRHRLTASGFFPCSIDREYLYGYAGVWKFDTLWEHPLGKGEATCHSSWLYSFIHRRYVEGYYKSSSRHVYAEDW